MLVTETADTPFSVISPLQRLDDGKTLYKLFSERPVRHLLHDMFADVRVVAEHKWAAYPRFAPPEQFAPFTLAPGIFYNNAWENAGARALAICPACPVESSLWNTPLEPLVWVQGLKAT